MEFLTADTLAEALAVKERRPECVPVAGGTDVMVELNLDRRRPAALLDLSRITELTQWSVEGDRVRLGAGVSYSRIMAEL
ncbi:MAG TPA: FAD binding domain-containing protein, partial [Micromonospora sp.]